MWTRPSRGLATPITAERKPIAAKAKKVAEKSPERRCPPIGRKLLATDRYQRDADRRERNRGDQGERRRIVERDKAEERDPRRLRLGIGDRDNEAAWCAPPPASSRSRSPARSRQMPSKRD